jgi:hypothetical protein
MTGVKVIEVANFTVFTICAIIWVEQTLRRNMPIPPSEYAGGMFLHNFANHLQDAEGHSRHVTAVRNSGIRQH